MLWKFRYRKPMGMHETLIEASTYALAERVGQAWVARQSPGHRYIGVEPAILATEAILVPLTADGPEPPAPAADDAPARVAHAAKTSPSRVGA